MPNKTKACSLVLWCTFLLAQNSHAAFVTWFAEAELPTYLEEYPLGIFSPGDMVQVSFRIDADVAPVTVTDSVALYKPISFDLRIGSYTFDEADGISELAVRGQNNFQFFISLAQDNPLPGFEIAQIAFAFLGSDQQPVDLSVPTAVPTVSLVDRIAFDMDINTPTGYMFVQLHNHSFRTESDVAQVPVSGTLGTLSLALLMGLLGCAPNNRMMSLPFWQLRRAPHACRYAALTE